jgi:multiple sugar transport system substrate-binding protein
VTTLRGMTWSHPRGYDPMVATSAVWRDRTGVEVVWDKRSLQDFETFPVEELARQYDLIVIDHPHVGQITAERCLAPLDIAGRENEREQLARQSVGQSYPSYTWEGRQWALPIDAATQVQAFRPDRLERPAESWDDVIILARAGHVVLPMLPPHSLMTFFTLAANMDAPCSTTQGDLIEERAGIEVVSRLLEITKLIEPSNFAMDPIAASEALARPEPLVLAMPFGYGYVNYAVDGFRPGRLQFADIPLPDAKGSALGGTGIAVSAHSASIQAAIDYAYWVASGDVQRGTYAASGGQPGNGSAWDDDAVNAAAHGFYRDTRRTLEGAWVRPRHNGYMAFQDAASQRLNAGLLSDEAPAATVAALNTLFRESF